MGLGRLTALKGTGIARIINPAGDGSGGDKSDEGGSDDEVFGEHFWMSDESLGWFEKMQEQVNVVKSGVRLKIQGLSLLLL